MSFARCLCFIITFACPLDFLRAQVPSAAPSLDDPNIEQRVTKLISEMTLEEEIGHFTIGRSELAFWNIDMQDVVEPASATVWIGPNSAEGQSADFIIAK